MTEVSCIATPKRAFSVCWENRRALGSFLGPWIAMTLACAFLGVLFFPDFASLMREGKAGLQHVRGGRWATMGLMFAFFLISTASFAVNWHRFLLIGDFGHSALRFDAAVWRYAGNGLVILILPLLWVGVAIGLISTAGLHFGLAAPLVSLSFTIAVFITTAKLSIKLPAVAIGRTDFGFQDAWRRSAGNEVQMAGSLLLVTLATGAVNSVASVLTRLLIFQIGSASLIGTLFTTAMQVLLWWLSLLLTVTVINVFYGTVVEGQAN